jgi:hypothetical protein
MNMMYSIISFVIISGAVIIPGCTDNSQGNNRSNLGPDEIVMQNFVFN